MTTAQKITKDITLIAKTEMLKVLADQKKQLW